MKEEDYSKYMYLIESIGVLKQKADELVKLMEETEITQFYFKLGQFCRELDELDDYCGIILDDLQVQAEKN